MSKSQIRAVLLSNGWKLSTVCSHVHGWEYACSFSFTNCKLCAALRRTEFKLACSFLIMDTMLEPSTSMEICSHAWCSSAPFTTWLHQASSCNWTCTRMELPNFHWFLILLQAQCKLSSFFTDTISQMAKSTHSNSDAMPLLIWCLQSLVALSYQLLHSFWF